MMENKVCIEYSDGRIKAESSQGTTNSKAVVLMMVAASENMLASGLTTDEIMEMFKGSLAETVKSRKDNADETGN
ncbi:hypothetical protein [Lactobacillus phage Sabazios]|nr:hypothetical protein [Lactobacillus phage Sabazios]